MSGLPKSVNNLIRKNTCDRSPGYKTKRQKIKQKSEQANTTVKSEIWHVSKIFFAWELLHNKQIHLCQIDPFIIRPT